MRAADRGLLDPGHEVESARGRSQSRYAAAHSRVDVDGESQTALRPIGPRGAAPQARRPPEPASGGPRACVAALPSAVTTSTAAPQARRPPEPAWRATRLRGRSSRHRRRIHSGAGVISSALGLAARQELSSFASGLQLGMRSVMMRTQVSSGIASSSPIGPHSQPHSISARNTITGSRAPRHQIRSGAQPARTDALIGSVREQSYPLRAVESPELVEPTDPWTASREGARSLA